MLSRPKVKASDRSKPNGIVFNTKGINSLTAKTTEAKNDLTEREIDDLADTRSQLFDLEKTLDRFTFEVEASFTDLRERSRWR